MPQVYEGFCISGHTFELMNDETRWQELDTMIGWLTDDPAPEWVDVKDLFDAPGR